MTLVEVVARLNRGVGGAQSLSKLRVALEADPQRPRFERAEGEHLAAHLEHRRLFAERELLLRAGARQAPPSQCPRGHRLNLYLLMAATRWAWTTATRPS